MSPQHSVPRPRSTWFRSRVVRRGAVALVLGFAASLAVAVLWGRERTERARARLEVAAERLDDLVEAPADEEGRSAIAWGYAQRLRLGLESPFRLIEGASRDPRLTADERRTVSAALLAHVMSGATHEIDPATLDGIGGPGATGEGDRHLRLIEQAVHTADNPRAAELAVRLAYTFAGAEQLVDVSAVPLVAGVAALVADRELARREAADVVRAAGDDPVDEVRARRARRSFYVERPTLLMTDRKVEREAIPLVATLVDSLRTVPLATGPAGDDTARTPDTGREGAGDLAKRLYRAGEVATPDAALAVTVKRFLPLVRANGTGIDVGAVSRSRNAEMLAAAAVQGQSDRASRRALGRLLVFAAVSMRSLAQRSVWFPGDSAPSAAQVAAGTGLDTITFDRDVPVAWRPFFLRELSDGLGDLRRVFPALRLESLRIRFRMSSPADSALAMHDPRTRTLHLPVLTAGGTLSHEIAHDLDRFVAQQRGHVGYRTDYVARNARAGRSTGADNRIASALRALTEEFNDVPQRTAKLERPAEIFATRVDWFVAQALASRGLSSGFLTAVQDELLTGHVVHPERLRSAGRSRSLIVALQGMTSVSPFAAREDEPGAHALARWALSAPIDRDVAAAILRGAAHAWTPPALVPKSVCDSDDDRATLVRLAAESRARGWVRLRARWMAVARRPPWARAALGQGPWSGEPAEERVAALRDHILTELSTVPELGAGLPAFAAPIAARSRCR